MYILGAAVHTICKSNQLITRYSRVVRRGPAMAEVHLPLGSDAEEPTFVWDQPKNERK